MSTKEHLPESFRPFFWSFRFDMIDATRHKKTIIVQTINYGTWKHWQWIAKRYGAREIARVVSDLPASEFRASALRLARIVFNIKIVNSYAQRSAH